MSEDQLKDIIKRLHRLEKAVFGGKGKPSQAVQVKGFAGLKGGLRFLISRRFFKAKNSLGDCRQELEKHGYHYSAAAVQTTLNRLARRTGPLAAFKQGGKKVYVERK